MSNEILNSLLREYEQKKLKAELDLEKREKEQLYKLIPRLEEIDKELNSSGINAAKQILFKSADSSIIDSLNNKIENLKKEKEKNFNRK